MRDMKISRFPLVLLGCAVLVLVAGRCSPLSRSVPKSALQDKPVSPSVIEPVILPHPHQASVMEPSREIIARAKPALGTPELSSLAAASSGHIIELTADPTHDLIDQYKEFVKSGQTELVIEDWIPTGEGISYLDLNSGAEPLDPADVEAFTVSLRKTGEKTWSLGLTSEAKRVADRILPNLGALVLYFPDTTDATPVTSPATSP